MTAAGENFLETAEFLGAKLSRDAIWSDKRCNWFGWPVTEVQAGRSVTTHRMCGPHFAFGTSGIAIFLGHLYRATQHRVFRMTAEGAIRQALSRLDDIPSRERFALSVGLTGAACALFEVARTCNIDKYNEVGLFILEEACRKSDWQTLDTGSIPALLKIFKDHPREFLLDTAVELGETLLTTNEKGFQLSFLELYRATGEQKFRDAFEAESMSALISLRAWKILRDDKLREKVTLALDKIEKPKTDTDFSLGSGWAEKGDLFIEAGSILKDANYTSAAERIGSFGIEKYRQADLPWPCGPDGKVETPGLTNGLAGIGYFYLRLNDSSEAPSLLCPRDES